MQFVLYKRECPHSQIGKELEMGVDIKATGFGRCLGFRYEKGGMYVMNLMQKVTDSFACGTECCMVPHKNIRSESYGFLWNITPQIISTCLYTQLNQTLFTSIRFARAADLTFGGQLIVQRKPTFGIYGGVSVEKATTDCVVRSSVNTQGTLSTVVQAQIRSIASNLLLSVQANPFIGTYTWGLSLQLFR